MSWFPIGPDFVFAPRHPEFKRLSRHNEFGRQGAVRHLALDPQDPTTLYAVIRPPVVPNATSFFRSDDGGASWTCISDSIQDPEADATCIAVHPLDSNLLYLGTWLDKGVYLSTDRGKSWSARHPVPGRISKLIVDPDPTTAAAPETTVLYAATDAGVFRSTDGGLTWPTPALLTGSITSLVAYFPTVDTGMGAYADTRHFFAGVCGQGVFHTSDPLATWDGLNAQNIGLAVPPFDRVRVDYCRLTPNRVYAWFLHWDDGTFKTVGLYWTDSPLAQWSAVTPVDQFPAPHSDRCSVFAVAPNSPGTLPPTAPGNSTDILFFGNVYVNRSLDGGVTWQIPPLGKVEGYVSTFGGEQMTFAFLPERPENVDGKIQPPIIYIGNDGGVGMSTGYADPDLPFDPTITQTDFNEGEQVDPGTATWRNLNHGLQTSAVVQYASDPAISALGYIACQDTAVGAGGGSLGWRGIKGGDAYAIAAKPGDQGVDIWYSTLGSPRVCIHTMADNGEQRDHPGDGPKQINSSDGGWGLGGSSNYVAIDDHCLAGCFDFVSHSTLQTAIEIPIDAATGLPANTPGEQTVTPSTMDGITPGAILYLDVGTDQRERVKVTATSGNTFTAVFEKKHATGAPIHLIRTFVGRMTPRPEAKATPVSQDFFASDQHKVFIVAATPGDPRAFVVTVPYENPHPPDTWSWVPNEWSTAGDQRLWRSTRQAIATGQTTWTEVVDGKPPDPLRITSVAFGADGAAYVLLSDIPAGSGNPLYAIEDGEHGDGTWVEQDCANLPATPIKYGKMVGHPVLPQTLYVADGGRVYLVQRDESGPIWHWTEVPGLPGPWVLDLWIGNIGGSVSPGQVMAGPAPRTLLRATVPTRGIWECDVTSGGAEDPAQTLYLRDNLLDQGWLDTSPEGRPNPYRPTEALWHYQCEDIKVDAPQFAETTGATFYQTDELPLPRHEFDMLRDNSQGLAAGTSTMVHVQVHNRSHTPQKLSVWAIYCNAAAGVPALNVTESGQPFDFWGQFKADGQIIAGLPADSPWTAIGPPQKLSDVDAARPQVASWSWTAPTPPVGDETGHYCVVAFVHSAKSPVVKGQAATTSFDVDAITPQNRQIGQKNLHIGPALPADGGPNAGPTAEGSSAQVMTEYVEFHNPTPSPREATLVFDLRNLPSALQVTFQLSELKTAKPLADSLVGVASSSGSGGTVAVRRDLGLLLRLLVRFVSLLVGPSRKPSERPRLSTPIRFRPTVYEARRPARVEVRGVRLPPFGFCAARITVRNVGQLEPGSEYRFEVQQQVGQRPVGGCTYVVRIAGVKNRPPAPQEWDTDFEGVPEGERAGRAPDEPEPLLPG